MLQTAGRLMEKEAVFLWQVHKGEGENAPGGREVDGERSSLPVTSRQGRGGRMLQTVSREVDEKDRGCDGDGDCGS